ncbi:MAG: 4Fe-4S binding protein [Candidatus Aenigmatarchaeota archaeon]
MKLSTTRHISQILFFLLIIYTSLFIVTQIDTWVFPFVEPNPDVARPEWYNPPTKYVEVLDTYGPVKTCRFIGGESRLFRACFLHFFTEGIIWLTPITIMIPHLLFFLGLVFVFGRAFCGWMCPLGFLQEVLGFLRKKLGIRQMEFSESKLKFMAMFRYGFLTIIILAALVLALPLGLSFLQGELSIIGCQTCPARIIFPIFSGNAPGYYSFSTIIYTIFAIIGLIFLSMFLLSFFYKRPFCRVCPSGTILSLFNTGSLLSKEKDLKKCTRCGICKRVCPMDNKKVYREKKSRKVDSANCIRCFSCVEHCPEKDCLKVKILGKEIIKSGKS